VPDFAAAAELLPRLGRRVLLTTGRQSLDAFAGLSRLWFLARCVDHPDQPLPGNVEILLARGPYAAADEAALLRRHRVDVLVTKDSGGRLTAGKLAAARELSLPVVMIDRPAPDPRGWPATVVSDVAGALAWVAARLAQPGGSAPPGQPGG
jgi:precorrin-6A/cobalt-precorrin-6A reductase